MNNVLNDVDFCFCYLNILIAFFNEEEHSSLKHLRTIFERLQYFRLTINVSKCLFEVSEISFLGYLVCSQIIKPTFEKVKLTFDYFFTIEFESKSVNISIERLKSTFLLKEPDFVPLYQR